MAQKSPPRPLFRSLAAALLLAGCTAPPPAGGHPADYPAFLQACKDATTDALVVNLAAHPDDEAARSLVFLRRKFGVRTVTVYSTCGEGGQNAIGREIGLDLARIRTRETLAAARYTGTEVRWLGFADFGYSKTAAETFRVWGRDRYTQRLRSILDEVQPDLALTNHSPNAGHGHHRASVIALREVLAEQAKGGRVVPVYQRATRPGAVPGVPGPGTASGSPASAPVTAAAAPARAPLDADIKFDVGSVDYMSGQTYARIAGLGWRQHRTQGVMGAFSTARRTPDSWKLVHPEDGKGARLFSFLGTVFDEPGFAELAAAQGVDAKAWAAEFEAFHQVAPPATHIERAGRLLPTAEKLAAAAPAGLVKVRLQRRIDALQRILLEGHSVEISARLSDERLAPDSRGHIDVKVAGPIRGLRARLAGEVTTGVAGAVRVPLGSLAEIDTDSVAPSWFRPELTFQVAGSTIRREVPVRFTAVPRVALRVDRPVRLVPTSARGQSLTTPVEIEWNGQQPLRAPLTAQGPAGWVVEVPDAAVRLAPGPTEAVREARVQIPTAPLSDEVRVDLRLDQGAATVRLRPVEVRAPASLRVALIRGVDDTLALTLADLRIPYEELDAEALAATDFGGFSTVVIDIRAYRTRKELGAHAARLLAWCEQGGRIVTFYHKPNEWNATDTRPLLAPHPLRVGRQRVSEESAAVTLLDPSHRLWHHPNQIVSSDFDGWVQERGLNFPDQWDKAWTPMVQMADEGEDPLQGALLYAKAGRGDYLYCSLALYRQLRKGHAGAARLLVNFLSK